MNFKLQNIWKKIFFLSNYILKHPSYDYSINDIALLKLSEPVKLTSRIQIACLPQAQLSSYPNSKIDSYAVGWGKFLFTNLILITAQIILNDFSKRSY